MPKLVAAEVEAAAELIGLDDESDGAIEEVGDEIGSEITGEITGEIAGEISREVLDVGEVKEPSVS
jgi:hypothetical protein